MRAGRQWRAPPERQGAHFPRYGARPATGEPRFAFNGTIHSVTFDMSGELISDDERELARIMAQQ